MLPILLLNIFDVHELTDMLNVSRKTLDQFCSQLDDQSRSINGGAGSGRHHDIVLVELIVAVGDNRYCGTDNL